VTVAELIEQLQEWPSDAEVDIVRNVKAPGSSSVYPIIRVGGAAGSHISGKDSIVTISADIPRSLR
jgi:hypothetical protein